MHPLDSAAAQRSTGTPQTTADSTGRRPGSREPSAVSQERTQSVPWPYSASGGYRIKMSAGGGGVKT